MRWSFLPLSLLTFASSVSRRHAEGPGGNEKTGRYYYGQDFGFLDVTSNCSMSNQFVETYDMHHQTVGGSLFQFTCPTNTYEAINGAYAPLNDAHYFSTQIFVMYKKWYDFTPLPNNEKLKVYVHYGQNQVVGHWDGKKMLLGDGDDAVYPLTSVDIIGHEIGHAITARHAKLVYHGQAGGINEAFSDMAGEVAEAFVNKHLHKKNDWLVGGTVTKGKGQAFRFFADPTLDNHSIAHIKNYYDGLDVHYASGLFNKAFYTLATTPNWHIRKAFHIFLMANLVYWRENSTFNEAACGVVKAGADLQLDTEAVIESFDVVGVNAHCPSF
jgi:pseudolysin/vibriolysin